MCKFHYWPHANFLIEGARAEALLLSLLYYRDLNVLLLELFAKIHQRAFSFFGD